MYSWFIKRMEKDGKELYRAYSPKPDMTVYDSMIFANRDAAVKRCQNLNGSNGGSVGVCKGVFPIGNEEDVKSEWDQEKNYL